MEEKKLIEVLPPEEPEYLKRQSILISLCEYTKLKQDERTVDNITKLVFATKTNYIDCDDLKLVLGIIGGNK